MVLKTFLHGTKAFSPRSSNFQNSLRSFLLLGCALGLKSRFSSNYLELSKLLPLFARRSVRNSAAPQHWSELHCVRLARALPTKIIINA